VTTQLLRSGATIQEINTVRKHLSAIQGGRLAAACRAPVLALIISDVTGDDPTHIAPAVRARSNDLRRCRSVLAKYRIAFPGRLSETPSQAIPFSGASRTASSPRPTARSKRRQKSLRKETSNP